MLDNIFRLFSLSVVLLLSTSMRGFAKERQDTITTAQGVDVYVKANYSNYLRFIGEVRIAEVESGLSDYVRVGGGVRLEYLFSRFVSFDAGYKGTYFSIMQRDAKDQGLSENSLKGFSDASGGIRLHVMDGKGWAKRKIQLRAFDEILENGMKHTTVQSLNAKFPCRRIWLLRGGVYYTNAPVSANLNGKLEDVIKPDASGTLTAADGTEFTGLYHTNSYTKGFYVGVGRIINMFIYTSNNIGVYESDEKLTSIFKETYFDVIFASTTFDPLVVRGKEYEIRPNTPGSFRVSDMGWRFGTRLLSTKNWLDTGVSAEVGNRPGIFQRGMYVSVGISIGYNY